MSVILYSTHCPKCEVLEKKLHIKNIEYTECADTELMIQKGFTHVPMLEVDGIVMDFSVANKWINEQQRRRLDEY